jgi:6-phosphogluconolactonase (cycloisomerase 2 family)
MRTNRGLWLAAFVGLAALACSEAPLEPGTELGLTASVAGLEGPGAVYLMTNATGGNSVIVFDRSADGQLTSDGTYATGGTGTGGGLGNQGSVILTKDHRRLYVVNAGSDDISAFHVSRTGLQLSGPSVPAGGQRPISLTEHGDLLYVLNAGGSGGIAGFRVGTDGALTPIPGSIRPLSSPTAGAAQIQFSPDGRILVVTEKATNTISTYTVGSDGVASGPNAQASAGQTPFGFNFNQRGDLVVSEAVGGGPGASTASSYRLDRDGNLALISGRVATTQTAACWIAISQNGSFAYTTNTGSGTISSLAIGPGATLTLVEAVAGTGIAPLDAAFTPGGRFLYVRNGGGTVGAFLAEAKGGLTHIGDFGVLPAGANGMAAR